MQNKIPQAQNVNNLQKSEIMPAVYRKIKAYLNPLTYNHLHFVDTTSPTGTVRFTKREQLEKTLLNHHKTHFSQAKNTPIAKNDVIQRFGLATETKHASNFRKGDNLELTYWTDPIIKLFLMSLMPNDNDPPKLIQISQSTMSNMALKYGVRQLAPHLVAANFLYTKSGSNRTIIIPTP